MGLRVRDAGGSEGRFVMNRIGVQTLLHAKAGRLPAGLSSRENLSAKHKQEFVDMTGGCPLARACGLRVSDRSSSPSAYREGLVAFKVSDRVLRGAFERLEPDAGKLARPVLRGEDDSNVILLPDSAGFCSYNLSFIFRRTNYFSRIKSMDQRYRIAIGRPGEPDAPLKGVGVKINRNS